MNMKVMVAQTNPCIGDLAGNLSLIQDSVMQAVSSTCDVVVFSELVTTGYPPRDLLYSPEFWKDHERVIDKLDSFVRQLPRQITVIVGGLHEVMLSGGRYARYNAAWILDKHFGRRVVHKRLLPCYDIFDETRYFQSGADEPYAPIQIHLVKDGVESDVSCDVLICEDIWNNQYCGGGESMKPATYLTDPLDDVERYGRGPLFVLNGSPFWAGKIEETQELVESICDRLRQPVVWCNQVGSHDDIVTGGYSMVSIPRDSTGTGVSTRRAKAFEADLMVVELDKPELASFVTASLTVPPFGKDLVTPQVIDPADFEMWCFYKALFLHMSDYRRRCGFKRAVLGLSGGIDSAVVAVIAAHVFGSENVTGIGMPSCFSSEGSVSDAEALAKNLKIRFELMKIDPIYKDVRNLFLSGSKQEFDHEVTDENIQPRARALLLMTYSNEHDPCLLLTTGNKSEITVGYCTINGDMCGGLAVISDLWKLQIYGLARFVNKYFGEPIPEDTITKPASAELREHQQDTDSLPPYEVLDPLLKLFVEREMSVEQVIGEGKWAEDHKAWFVEAKQTPTEVARIMFRKYRSSEYKRLQMPPGPKVQQRSFGSGRRIPIAMNLTRV